MPIGRVAIVSTVLAQRSNKCPVLEGKTSDGYWLEELRELLILGEIGLEKGEIRDRTLQGCQLGVRTPRTAG